MTKITSQFPAFICLLFMFCNCGGSGGSGSGSNGTDPSGLIPVKNVVASTEYPEYDAKKAVDSSYTTSWASKTFVSESPQWIYLDFGSPQKINQVIISWGEGYGKYYKLQESDDAQTWTDVFSTTSGVGHFDNTTLPSAVNARYLRLYITHSCGDSWIGAVVEEFSVYSDTGHNAPNGPTDGNMIWNSDFSSDIWKWFVNFQSGGAGSYSFADGRADVKVSDGGSAPYSVQLLQNTLSLRKGKTYILSFDGWADSSKNCTISLHEHGEDIDGDGFNWTDYCHYSFSLGTSRKTYVYHFTMNKNDDPAATLELDMGNNTGDFHFDNFSLKELSSNMIHNGNFSDGVSYWCSFNKNYTTDTLTWTIEKDGSDNYTKFNYTLSDHTNWYMQLFYIAPGNTPGETPKYPNFTLVKGKQYLICFDAWSPTLSDIDFQFAEPGEDLNGDGEIYSIYFSDKIKLTSTRTTYSYIFTMNNPTDTKGGFKFSFGYGDGTSCIDNVELYEIQ